MANVDGFCAAAVAKVRSEMGGVMVPVDGSEAPDDIVETCAYVCFNDPDAHKVALDSCIVRVGVEFRVGSGRSGLVSARATHVSNTAVDIGDGTRLVTPWAVVETPPIFRPTKDLVDRAFVAVWPFSDARAIADAIVSDSMSGRYRVEVGLTPKLCAAVEVDASGRIRVDGVGSENDDGWIEPGADAYAVADALASRLDRRFRDSRSTDVATWA